MLIFLSKTIVPGDIDFMFVRNRHHPYFTPIQVCRLP